MFTPYKLSRYATRVCTYYQLMDELVLDEMLELLVSDDIEDISSGLDWRAKASNNEVKLNGKVTSLLRQTAKVVAPEIEESLTETAAKTSDGIKKEIEDLTGAPAAQTPKEELQQKVSGYVNTIFRDIDENVNDAVANSGTGIGSAVNSFRNVVDSTVTRMIAGEEFKEALKQSMFEYIERGLISRFTASDGSTWSVERYINTTMRQVTNDIYNTIRWDELDLNGIDLVSVSSHIMARPACSGIQGRVASRSMPSSNKKYPSIYAYGYGTPGGLRGINCRHMLFPYIEGISNNNQPKYDPAKAEFRGKMEQEQRRRERAIRLTKKKLQVVDKLGIEPDINRYKNLLRKQQANMREFLSDKDYLVRQYDREKY